MTTPPKKAASGPFHSARDGAADPVSVPLEVGAGPSADGARHRSTSPDLHRTLAIGPITIRFGQGDVGAQLDREMPKLARAGILVRADAKGQLHFTSDSPFTICGDPAILTALGLVAGTHPAQGNFAAERDYDLTVNALKAVATTLRMIPARVSAPSTVTAEDVVAPEQRHDLSEEAANLLALEVRQQLSGITKSLTAYAEHTVLRFLR